MNQELEKEIEVLETQLRNLKDQNKGSWDIYGSELCAGHMIKQERELEEQINILKEKLK